MKKRQAKVAIITRTKDRVVLLERTLESLAAQTYSNYIHVIVNDGGDKKMIDKLLGGFDTSKQVVLHNSQSQGLVKTLNQGIQAVNSEYIAVFDDDDTWAPNRLELTVRHLDETQAKAVVVSMDIIYEEVKDGKIHFISQNPHPDSNDGEINLYKQCLRNYISNGIVLYRRDVYNEIGGYDESLLTSEDWDFGIRLLLKYDVELLRTTEPLFHYHQRPKQVGADGNSVHAGVREQERTLNILRNKYLRNDLNNGKYGVGVIMNQMTMDINNIVRLEGHMNYVGSEIKSNIDTAAEYIIGSNLLRATKRKVTRFLKH